VVKAIAHQGNFHADRYRLNANGVANGFLHAVKKVFNRHQHEMHIVAMSKADLFRVRRNRDAFVSGSGPAADRVGPAGGK